LGDILTYRLPQQEIIRLNGTFKEIQQFEGINGFIVTSFDKSKKFHFAENKKPEPNNSSNETPVCYSKSEYNEIATSFLNKIKKQNLSKAIFSRVRAVNLEIEPFQFFNQLCLTYPNAFVYFISSPLFGTWIGASPEILIESTGKSAETMSLAGTLSRDSNEKWESKEKNEQDYVTTYINNKLIESGVENLQISDQQEVNAGPVRHLKTTFQFDLGSNSAIAIADKLHPTPAVSGYPQKEALDLIHKSEKHQRRIYAGMIGVINEHSTQLFVNLRCAEIIHNQAYLYLGGGFTKDSNVVSEWNETENKAKTLLNVMKKQ
jgi:isochorismate synthase